MIAQSAPVLTGIRHMVTHHERTTALAAGWLSWNAGMAVETTTGNTGLGVWAQLGVAGLIVVAIMFMLRRSDQRDNAKDKAIAAVEDARIADLKAQIDTLQQLLEDAKRSPATRTRRTDRKPKEQTP